MWRLSASALSSSTKGKLLYDGALTGLINRFASHKTIVVDFDPAANINGLTDYGEVVEREASKVTLRVRNAAVPATTSRLLADLPVLDLSIQEQPIEAVIERVFADENNEASTEVTP